MAYTEEPAGFVVITFGSEDEDCPLGRCVVGAFVFEHTRQANAYARSLDPADIDQYPHVVPLTRVVEVK